MSVIKIHPQNSHHLSFTLQCQKTVCGVHACVHLLCFVPSLASSL